MTDPNTQNGLKKYLTAHAASLVVTLLIQSAFLIWWASAINTRVNILDRDVQKIDGRVLRMEVAKQ